MPKKKKGKKKEGKKGEDKAKEAQGGDSKPTATVDKELALRQELSDLNAELTTLKKQVDDLRMENDWLQEEAEKTRAESQDYQTYVSRKAQKRQSLIVSLSDHNQQELRQILRQREELARDFEEKRTGLSATLLEKESELSKVQKELRGLEPYRALQCEQDREVERLEWELEEMRFRHEDRVRALKTQFLLEKRAFENATEARIRTMADKASKQASESLQEHTQRVRTENQRLRAQLQQLIETTSDLQLQKKKLEKQYQALLREQQYTQDLQLLRGPAFRSLDSGSGYTFGAEGGGGSGTSLPGIAVRSSSVRR